MMGSDAAAIRSCSQSRTVSNGPSTVHTLRGRQGEIGGVRGTNTQIERDTQRERDRQTQRERERERERERD